MILDIDSRQLQSLGLFGITQRHIITSIRVYHYMGRRFENVSSEWIVDLKNGRRLEAGRPFESNIYMLNENKTFDFNVLLFDKQHVNNNLKDCVKIISDS